MSVSVTSVGGNISKYCRLSSAVALPEGTGLTTTRTATAGTPSIVRSSPLTPPGGTKAGGVDGRPFFPSMRQPVIEYPDRQTNEPVAELARKVEQGTVRLRFDKD